MPSDPTSLPAEAAHRATPGLAADGRTDRVNRPAEVAAALTRLGAHPAADADAATIDGYLTSLEVRLAALKTGLGTVADAIGPIDEVLTAADEMRAANTQAIDRAERAMADLRSATEAVVATYQETVEDLAHLAEHGNRLLCGRCRIARRRCG